MLKLAAGGLAVGVPAAIVITRVPASLLVGVIGLDIPRLVGLPCTTSDPPQGNAQ